MRQGICLAVMLSCGVARGDIIYLSQNRSATVTTTIAQAVPVTKTQTVSATDFGPFGFGAVSQSFAPLSNYAMSDSGISGLSVLGANQLQIQNPIDAIAAGDSINLYGSAATTSTAIITFTTTDAQAGSINARLQAPVRDVINTDDKASVSFSLVGPGVSLSASLPNGNSSSIQVSAPFNPIPGQIYTLTLLASVSADGAFPLTTGNPPISENFPTNVNSAGATFGFTLTQGLPEPSGLELLAVGTCVLVAASSRRHWCAAFVGGFEAT